MNDVENVTGIFGGCGFSRIPKSGELKLVRTPDVSISFHCGTTDF